MFQREAKIPFCLQDAKKAQTPQTKARKKPFYLFLAFPFWHFIELCSEASFEVPLPAQTF
jgi:hypothetical protein